MKNCIKLIFVLMFLVLVSSCNKCKEDAYVACYDETDKDCENYNPCWDAANAYWRIMPYSFIEWESGDFWDSTFFLDPKYDMVDSLYNGYTTFNSMYEADSYQWKFGFDPTIRTTKDVTDIGFQCCTGPIKITLISDKKKQITCPNDDGRDTFSRELVLVEIQNDLVGVSDTLDIVGQYIGQDDGRPESLRIVEIKFFPLIIGEYFGYKIFNIIDMPNEDITAQEITIGNYNRLACYHFATPSSTRAYQVKIKGKMITQDSILLEYEYKNKDQQNLPLIEQVVTKGTFRGIKVQ